MRIQPIDGAAGLMYLPSAEGRENEAGVLPKRKTITMKATFALAVALCVPLISDGALAESGAPVSPAPPVDSGMTITNTSGRIFTNVEIKEVRPDGLKVFHSKGVALIPFRELPEQMRLKHGYDPVKEKEFRKEQAEQQSARAAQKIRREIADRVAGSGRNAVLEIIQITDDGALAKGYWIEEEEYDETEAIPIQYNYIEDRTRYRHERVTRKRLNRNDFAEKIFVVDTPATLVDGNTYRAVIYPCGRHQYTTVMGAQATVERYATTISRALALLGL
jgi:hypothetical protein